jgi:hypothetical protein
MLGKKISMTSQTLPSPRIPLHSCAALLDKLKWDYAQFEDGWTEYRTFNFVITAYHLYVDWIKSAGSRSQKLRKGIISAHPQGKLLFNTLRDITNATKHWKLDAENKGRQIVSEVTSPQIADWNAYFNSGPVVYVTVGTARPSMSELADMTVKCLNWIVNGTNSSIPADIEDGLNTIFRPLIV